jgi:hypothetical protein
MPLGLTEHLQQELTGKGCEVNFLEEGEDVWIHCMLCRSVCDSY